jgi:hypothetical protein
MDADVNQTHLMDADVLLLRLDHPDSLFSHLEDDAEDVHHVGLPNALHMQQRGITKASTEVLQDIPRRKKCFTSGGYKEMSSIFADQ